MLPHGYTGRKFSFAPMCLRRRRPGEDHRAGLGVLQKPPLWWWTLTSAAPLLSISSHFWTTLGDIISARDKERQTAKRPPGCSCNCYLCWCKLGCRPLMYDDKPNLVFLNELCAIFFMYVISHTLPVMSCAFIVTPQWLKLLKSNFISKPTAAAEEICRHGVTMTWSLNSPKSPLPDCGSALSAADILSFHSPLFLKFPCESNVVLQSADKGARLAAVSSNKRRYGVSGFDSEWKLVLM